MRLWPQSGSGKLGKDSSAETQIDNDRRHRWLICKACSGACQETKGYRSQNASEGQSEEIKKTP